MTTLTWDLLDEACRNDLARCAVGPEVWAGWTDNQRRQVLNIRAKFKGDNLWQFVGTTNFGSRSLSRDNSQAFFTIENNDGKGYDLAITLASGTTEAQFRQALNSTGIRDDGKLFWHRESQWSHHEGRGISIHVLGYKTPSKQFIQVHWDHGGGNWYNPKHWWCDHFGMHYMTAAEVTGSLCSNPLYRPYLILWQLRDGRGLACIRG